MKRVLLFLLFLFIQLLGVHHFAHASLHPTKSFSPLINTVEKTQSPAFDAEKKNFLLTKTGDFSGEDATIVSVDDDDENEDLFKKNIAPVRSFTAIANAFISYYFYNSFTESHAFYKHPFFSGSSKYIVQRTLRL